MDYLIVLCWGIFMLAVFMIGGTIAYRLKYLSKEDYKIFIKTKLISTLLALALAELCVFFYKLIIT